MLGSLAVGAVLFAVLALPSIAGAAGAATSYLMANHHQDDGNDLTLSPTSGSMTPDATGAVEWNFVGGVLSGHLEVRNLPASGTHLAYVFWYVNTATGDKAFLGPIIEDGAATILFQIPGNGHGSFTASTYTSGTDAGGPISLAPTGENLVILLVENAINFASPSPVGTSVSATF